MADVMQPNQADTLGNVSGGELMKFMDNAAWATAMQYAKSNVVTARADELNFFIQIPVGSFVTCIGEIVYVGNSSMEVKVTVEIQDLQRGTDIEKALTAYFTMVALEDNGRPKKIEAWEPQTDEEKIEHRKVVEKRKAHKREKEYRKNNE